jgi:hypothetical protein
LHEGAEFAVTLKLYVGGVDDLFAQKFHAVGGVEAAVFALGPN